MEIEYNKISKVIEEYECFNPFPSKTIDWICDRIDWAWKWKRITEEQMEELTDRITEVMKYA